MTYSIVAGGLVKRFGDTVALAGVDLAVRTGSVFGLLGPNGAGKTTSVRILATLVRPDAGHATVGGHDVVASAHQVRQLIGLAGQHASVDETLTGLENLLLAAGVGPDLQRPQHRYPHEAVSARFGRDCRKAPAREPVASPGCCPSQRGRAGRARSVFAGWR